MTVMATRIAINGFGRIGRLALRTILARYPDDLEVVAINDIGDPETNAYLFKYDSNYGLFTGSVKVSENTITVDGHSMRAFSATDPARIPWHDVAADRLDG